MKKIGKKLSYMTKVLLVLGLIISNLSSLTVVFADVGDDDGEPSTEVSTPVGDDVVPDEEGDDTTPSDEDEVVGDTVATGLEATIGEDNKITVIYAGEIDDTDELEIRITERYKYNNCEDTDSITCENVINNTYSVTKDNRDLLLGDGMVINYTPSLLDSAKFDGLYTLTVMLVNVTVDDSIIDEKVISEVNNTFESGILFKVYDSTDALISATSGKYVIDTSIENIKAVGKMQAGGISPNDVFEYEETEYTALEMLDLAFEYPINLNDYLYGDFNLPLAVFYSYNSETVQYNEVLNISHGTYEDNTNKLNSFADSDKFLFEGTTKDGKLYIYLGDTEITLNDVDAILSSAYSNTENITYNFSNEVLNAETLITITDGINSITYQVILAGDINDDGILDENDIVALTDQLVGNDELNLDKVNIDDSDNEANTHDVLKLTQIIKTGAWGITPSEKEIQLEATLETSDGVTEFVTGDKFDVNYLVVSSEEVVTGFAGLVKYDTSLLKLISITETDDYIGSNNEGKFVYVGINELTETSNVKLLTLRFETLKGGNSTITIDNPEFFNGNTYFTIVEVDEETGENVPTSQVISLDVTTSVSSDGSLSSLELGDYEIQLEDGVYEYSLSVGSDVTQLDVTAMAANSAASIIEIVSPEELVEGENTVTITVLAEDGQETTYTITVTRESTSEGTDNTDTNNGVVNQYNGYNNGTNNNNNNQQKPSNNGKDDPEPVVDPAKEKSGLSKIIIIVLIVLVIAGLIYLIFKDDDDESKKANKDINKFKKEDFDSPSSKTTSNGNNSKNQNLSDKKNQNRNNKKGK